MPGYALLRRSEGQVHEVQQIGALEYRDEGYFYSADKRCR